MKKITEWNIWTWDIFGDSDESKSATAIRLIAWTIIVAYLSFMFGMIVVSCAGLPDAALWYLLIPTLLAPIVANLGRIHPLWGVKDVGSGYRNRVSLRYRAEQYLELPAEDRALYPSNILTVLKNPDLTIQQAKSLDTQMGNVYVEIVRRNKAKALFERREIDISDVLTSLETSKAHVKIEADTLNEYLDK